MHIKYTSEKIPIDINCYLLMEIHSNHRDADMCLIDYRIVKSFFSFIIIFVLPSFFGFDENQHDFKLDSSLKHFIFTGLSNALLV